MAWSVLAGTLLASALAAQAVAAEAGAPAAWARCAACHTAEGQRTAADPAAVGPSLQSLAGRAAGSLAGFRYSGPLRRSGLVWDAATLTDFLRDPQARVPGNRMAFSGVDDAAELQALVAWLLAAPAALSSPPAERAAP